jgi:GDP-L-fucose synthase
MPNVLVTGGSGLVGSATKDLFAQNNYVVFAPNSSELNLLDREAVFEYFDKNREIDILIHSAARVGGILGNRTYPAIFIGENLRIQSNVFEAAAFFKIPKLIFIASSCIYPSNSPLPLQENSLFNGKFEESNRWYASAKSAGIMQVEAIRLQYGLDWLSVLPTNIYGPNDNFALSSGHVMPALISKFASAIIDNKQSVTIWGTGTPFREFIYSYDVASALIAILNSRVSLDPPFVINLGSGYEISIRELANLISKISNFKGVIEFNNDYPDGVFRKTLDSSIIRSLGWKPEFNLENGIKSTLSWVYSNISELRTKEITNVSSILNKERKIEY